MPYSEQDYYQVLGVPRDADVKTIKQAYHTLAMKWHPDRNKNPEAEERFKHIAKAYAILKDPKKRAQYDALGMEGVAHYTPEDLFGGLDFGDLFGDMGFDFGGVGIFDRMFGHRRARPAHGKDLRVRTVKDRGVRSMYVKSNDTHNRSRFNNLRFVRFVTDVQPRSANLAAPAAAMDKWKKKRRSSHHPSRY